MPDKTILDDISKVARLATDTKEVMTPLTNGQVLALSLIFEDFMQIYGALSDSIKKVQENSPTIPPETLNPQVILSMVNKHKHLNNTLDLAIRTGFIEKLNEEVHKRQICADPNCRYEKHKRENISRN